MSIRGLVYCVSEARLFPWKMATWGSHSSSQSPGSVEKAGSLQVPDFVTSLLDFIPLNIFLKHQNPTITFTCLIMPEFGGASFSVLLSNSLSWAGKEARRAETTLLFPACLFGALSKAAAGSTHRPSVGRTATATPLPLAKCWRSPQILAFLRLCEPIREEQHVSGVPS